MRNIHILPTDNPTNLVFEKFSNRYFTNRKRKPNTKFITNQHIYITSDKEIKDGDWVYNLKNMDILRYQESDMTRSFYKFGWRKIILTTDQDLIKDGVQDIDDDFLEWFVKNPSCERVGVIYEPKNFLDTKQGWEYEIIIPKDEIQPQQIWNEEKMEGVKKLIQEQETLEDFIKRESKSANESVGIVKGAKWQQDKKMYSEEEMILYSDYVLMCSAEKTLKIPLQPKEWFEKFKKK
jgi:hypothetical protein